MNNPSAHGFSHADKSHPLCCFPAFAAGKMPAAKATKGKLGRRMSVRLKPHPDGILQPIYDSGR